MNSIREVQRAHFNMCDERLKDDYCMLKATHANSRPQDVSEIVNQNDRLPDYHE